MTHRVNQYFDYSLSAGRSVDLQYDGQPNSRYFVQWSGNWHILRKFQLTTPLSWEHGKEIYYQSVSYDQYVAAINIARQITQKLSGAMGYQFIEETSDQASLNYTANIVSLSLTYQF